MLLMRGVISAPKQKVPRGVTFTLLGIVVYLKGELDLHI